MSNRYFYRDESITSSSSDSDYQVQYSSSSIDRSSIGSIPWADDAIKQNQQDWERVERMFCGEEDLSDTDPELKKEILEWHRKFPHILRPRNSQSDSDKLSNFSFTSYDNKEYDEDDDDDEDTYIEDYEDDPTDGAITPTNRRQNLMCAKHSAKSLEPLPAKQILEHEQLLNKLANDLRISSVPTTERRVQNIMPLDLRLNGEKVPMKKRNVLGPLPKSYRNLGSSTLASNSDHGALKNGSSSATPHRMPPILKIMEAKHSFRKYPSRYEKSFVQLTTPNQPQSAAATTRSNKWYPRQVMAGSEMNKNAIILPAIKLQKIHESAPLVGRSISAALNHRQLNWTYLPYSAAKFKMHK